MKYQMTAMHFSSGVEWGVGGLTPCRMRRGACPLARLPACAC